MITFKARRQIIIFITSASAIWLVNSPDPEMRFLAAIFGIIGQPLWFYESYKAKQWGVFASCFFFLGGWIFGIVNYVKV